MQRIPCPPARSILAPTPAAAEHEALKARQKATWGAGDYAVLGVRLQLVSEELCAAADLHAGQRVLDVATGNGSTALAAARCWAEVVGVDFVPALLQNGRARAAAERLAIDFREGDAEHLPCVDGEFDAVLSTFGAMFAPDQAQAARELVRACRPGGKIALASWTPDGFIGQSFAVIGAHVPPPLPRSASPLAWGTEKRMLELFGASATCLRTERKHFAFRYRSVEHWLETMRTCYGPMQKTFEALDALRQAALTRDLVALVRRLNVSGDDTVVLPSEYLQVVITKA